MHALQIQTNIMYTTLLLAPLTPILQPPKQKRTPLAESYRRIFSATVVVETAEKRGQKWKRCDSSFPLLKKHNENEPRLITRRELLTGGPSVLTKSRLFSNQRVCVCVRVCEASNAVVCMHFVCTGVSTQSMRSVHFCDKL